MLGWIDDCGSNHTECQLLPFPSQRGQILPSRLLHILDEDQYLSTRLVETDSLLDSEGRPSWVKYAALSHMWGDVESAPPLQTMCYNYGQMKEGLDMTQLPRNFIDAIKTCLSLGINYLWIDSLCIVQDDETDWQREAALMHEVYKNAHVTIVA
jgi:dimeric dUTPase (all-alpha-NTP-PPase superfamily)